MAKLLASFLTVLLLSVNYLVVLALPGRVMAQGSCLSMEEAINSRGWEGIEDVQDNGVRVNLPDDSDLPIGFEAIAEDAHISIDNPDRFMGAGVWSVYRVCTGEVEPPDETCPEISDLIESNGWEGIEQVDEIGVRVRTFLDDSLPFGYEGIGEDSFIVLDDPNRFMSAGEWSIYRLCGEDP